MKKGIILLVIGILGISCTNAKYKQESICEEIR